MTRQNGQSPAQHYHACEREKQALKAKEAGKAKTGERGYRAYVRIWCGAWLVVAFSLPFVILWFLWRLVFGGI